MLPLILLAGAAATLFYGLWFFREVHFLVGLSGYVALVMLFAFQVPEMVAPALSLALGMALIGAARLAVGYRASLRRDHGTDS